MSDYQEGWNAAIEKAADVCDNEGKRQTKIFNDYVKSGGDGPATCYASLYHKMAKEILAIKPEEQVDDGGFDAWWERQEQWTTDAKLGASIAWNAARQHPAPPVSDEPVAWCYYDDDGALCFSDDVPGTVPLYLHPTPNASAEPKHGLPGFVTPGFSRREWHDKAWALFNTKTFDDTQLSKVNMHTMRAVFDATFDALNEATPNASVEMERDDAMEKKS